MKCNTYDNMYWDKLVLWDGPVMSQEMGIAVNQGSAVALPENMAGNLFDDHGTANGDFDDMLNEANDYNYYYPQNYDQLYENVVPKDYTELTITADDVFIPGGIDWTYENGCPPEEEPGGGGGSGEEELRGDMENAVENITATEAILAVLIDGGNTEALNTEVETSIPPESMQVYNELMGNSPYLSDTVVSSAIGKEDVLPNAMIRDIMVANPHTAKSNELMAQLDERWDPLPEYMKAQVLQGKSIVSIKEELESELAGYKQQKAKAFNGLVRWFINDTLNPVASSDSLVMLFQQDNTLSSKYSLVMLHLERNELQTALDVLNSIANQFNLQGDDLTKHQEVMNYCNLIVDLMNEDKTILEVDSIQLNQLLTMEAMQEGLATVYARNILLALNEIEFDEPILLPDLLKSSQVFEEYLELLNVKPPKQIEVYPNPSDDYVILSYNLEIDKPGYSIRITDLNGKTVKMIGIYNNKDQIVVDTQNWKPGIYISALELNGIPVESVKFTIL
ncbi:MAG: T9SS type A sorting domain-containing protein [Bacteroidales bacterium]